MDSRYRKSSFNGMIGFLLTLCFCWAELVSGQMDTSVCDPNNNPRGSNLSAKLPNVPNEFEVHIECVVVNSNLTTDVHEFFDYDGNQGEVRQTRMNISLWAYYSYSTNEFIMYYPDINMCVVDDLSRSDQRFLFGYKHKGGDIDRGHIFTAWGALHFSENEVYMGKANVRGIPCNYWYSCQYWDNMNASMIIQWYFSDNNTWDVAIGSVSIPVRIYVKGNVHDTPTTSHPFEHYYEFFHYNQAIQEPRAFETPSGVSCPGRKNTKPLPDLPLAYSFTGEIIDQVREEVSFMREWFDDKMKMSMFKYKPTRMSNGEFGFRPLTEIHDFNTGVAYITDDMIGNCTARPIEKSSGDDKSIDPHHVRIRSSREFFHLDNVNATYEGVKNIRNVDTDSWVAKRGDVAWFPGRNTTWEWYFRLASWTATQDSVIMFDGATPLQLRFSVPDLNMKYTYNIYNFLKTEPNLLDIDISGCYINLNRRKFDFTVPGKYASMIQENQVLFKYACLLSITSYSAVSPLRIAHLRLVFKDNVHIRFEMLDVAPVAGDVLKNYTAETPLYIAAAALIDAVNSGNLVIPLDYDTLADRIYIVAQQGSLVEFVYEDELEKKTGYSPGAMGGLGFSMLIIGGGIGSLVAFFFFK